MTKKKPRFSHIWYDDITRTLFMYFKGVHIQTLGQNKNKGKFIKECCLHLSPLDFQKMKDAFAKAEKVEDLLIHL